LISTCGLAWWSRCNCRDSSYPPLHQIYWNFHLLLRETFTFWGDFFIIHHIYPNIFKQQLNTTKKCSKLRGLFFHFAGVSNLCKLFPGFLKTAAYNHKLVINNSLHPSNYKLHLERKHTVDEVVFDECSVRNWINNTDHIEKWHVRCKLSIPTNNNTSNWSIRYQPRSA
jgi:hypothetical protein